MTHLTPSQSRFLREHGFDRIPFDELKGAYVSGDLTREKCLLKGEILLPREGDLSTLPLRGSEEQRRLAALGTEAIRAGHVGVVVLNGGMATRFGGLVKGVVEAYGGRSFLDWKLAQVDKVGGGKAPVFLMNSFATDAATAEHLDTLKVASPVESFRQFVSLRLDPTGAVFEQEPGNPSFYAPGHGDFPYALCESGVLERFVAAGGRYLTLSNVDNLGATLDPAVIGAHIEGERPMTVELVETRSGDVGGFPARVGERLIIAEAFRLPGTFDLGSVPLINTNTFVFDAKALLHPPELEWFVAVKEIGGKKAIQFERLVGQLSEFWDVTWLKVPREGACSRFAPIKLPEDLELRGRELADILGGEGLI